MDKLKRLRGSVRAIISRTTKDVDVELTSLLPMMDYLMEKQEKLEELREEVKAMDQEIVKMMVDDDCSEDELTAEYQSIEDYSDRIRKAIFRIKKVSKVEPTPVVVPSGSGTQVDQSIKLPKIEIKKFSGNLTEWLPFWSQFQKIHDNKNLHDSDKIQYLIQSTVPGSEANDLVEGFYQTAANYPKVIEALRERFGNEKLLKQVYIRELQSMVIHNLKSKEKMPLSKMHDKLKSHLESLESLGVTIQQSAFFLYPFVESSLSEKVLDAWQRSPLYGKDGLAENPPKNELDYLMQFLKEEVLREQQKSLARGEMESSSKGSNKSAHARKSRDSDDFPTAAGLFAGKGQNCVFCDKGHDSMNCYQSKKLSLEEKKSRIQKSGACFNCLKSGHASKKCKVFVKCLVCDLKHLTLMCPSIHGKDDQKEAKDKAEGTTVSGALNCTSEVLLQTLLVKIKGQGRDYKARLMFDSGSQMSFVKKSTISAVGLDPIGKEMLRKALFGGTVTEPQTHHKYRLQLESLDPKYSQLTEISVLDEKSVCGRIPRIPHGPWLAELKEKNIWLSDMMNGNADIDILVGSDVMGEIMTGRVVKLKCGLTATETTLGWTIYGRLPFKFKDNLSTLVITNFVSNASVEDLWSLETIGIRETTESLSKEDKEVAAIDHFKKTVSRQEDGRYSVSLPWVTQGLVIPTNKGAAEARLRNATNKLKAQKEYEAYDGVFKQWNEEGIIEEVPKTEVLKASHYLPHRPVFKPESLTTPVRPVFDASCKSGRSPSLNDCLEKGPNLMELIPSILLRFREKKVGVVSDIRKAFQMVSVKKEDRNHLRFLWWEDQTQQQLKEYRHARVVFGVNCSPFLLAAVLDQHLRSVQDERKFHARKLLGSLYVDNCVTSVDTYEEYKEFRSVSTELMAEAKMDLRQWECSIEEGARVGPTMEPGCGLEPSTESTSSTVVTSVLGLKWDKLKDQLYCTVPKNVIIEKVTKRVILSQVQRIFDPMGFLAPAWLPPKLMIQRAWAKEVTWDQELDEKAHEDFGRWWKEASILQQVRIPRNATGGLFSGNSQIHVFCDASQEAFAAVIFLRVQDGERVSVQLLQAKTRVAPLKKVTIPRLELLSCTIAARLAMSVTKALEMEKVPKYLWSDSTTALAWIKRNDEWGTFVGNRVREICRLTNVKDWNHVPGIMNPADLPSRGCSPRELLQSRWWEGPAWLKLTQEECPSQTCDVDEEEVLQERRKTAAVMTYLKQVPQQWYCRRFSSYLKNLRTLAWILRFVDKLRKKSNLKGDLSVLEVSTAERVIFRLVQEESFSLKGSEGIIEGVRVQKEDGIFYVITKLTHRKDDTSFIKPVLLPNHHPLVEQMIRQAHRNHHHAGIQFLMGKLREKVWILCARREIKRVIHGCVTCRRHSCKAPNVPEAPLPEDRVKTAKAFEVTGVDLAGPLFLKEKKKAWIVLFTCAVYRCVHLELVQSLSTEAFMLALHRFISRRGRPTIIYSDNGTNFVGTDNLFKEMDWKRIERETRVSRIQWKFNPPSAAWWGGWWERLIRSIKDLIKRMLGHQKLNYVQLETSLCEVEAVMNGRPLTYVTEDPEDLIPLSPRMFLQDIQESQFPEGEVLDGDGLRNTYNGLKELKEELRCRFRKEYLSQLITRGKGKKPREFLVGDVVLVGSDNRKRLDWPLGRIQELLVGKDGKFRVAKVKTATGVFVRPLQRLYPLEVSSDESVPVSEIVKVKAVKDAACTKSVDVHAWPEVRTRRGRLVKPPVRLGYVNLSYLIDN